MITAILGVSWILHGFPGPLGWNLICYALLFLLGFRLLGKQRRKEAKAQEDAKAKAEAEQT